MEKGIDSYIREQFGVRDVDVRTYSPLTLAYIGDAIYELVIRTLVVGHGNTAPNKLHKKTSSIVCAKSQSDAVEKITPYLTEEETGVLKRGRNAKSFTSAKNATIAEYRRATGFEALMGYLYLTDQTDRLIELVKISLEESEDAL